MNKNIQDKLINAIKTLLSEAHPDYIFEEIYEDSGIHFLGEKYIRDKILGCGESAKNMGRPFCFRKGPV